MEKLYFIVNPLARNGYSQEVWDKVEGELQTNQIQYAAYFTEYRGHAKEICYELLKRVEDHPLFIIVVGGDGTIHEVINGMSNERQARIGFIPAGSGNDFSRGFGFPNKPLEAFRYVIDSIVKGEGIVDIGNVISSSNENTSFINNLGVGFDALISYEANRSPMKKRLNRYSLGSLVYAYILIKKLFTFKCSSMEVVVDGKAYVFPSVWFITVSNQPYFGGGMMISPTASPTDGILNITVVDNLSKLKLLFVFISVFWGGHTVFNEVKSLTGKRITVRTSVPQLVHVDGEHLGCTPVEIQVKPRAVSVIGNVKAKKGEIKEANEHDFH
ncbi:diacylglycerol kinase family lipid kinase [Cytobacillus spongiae]|jgi:YegS/Rv2252/BmrU family lipid kinase|uniref:diacylglycerol/lipid kinase family protein n=1 Tax=Cytobacillus spongiae TaxID=2901381 RepID=UPI001F32CA75|nr:diacylglycerol kinase family protein [Cytobacillus spongiae]UII55243.1 diacylglycerol kinase family lipid kinase [Cytobacillus spongiae]